jgi:hypothetical protein
MINVTLDELRAHLEVAEQAWRILTACVHGEWLGFRAVDFIAKHPAPGMSDEPDGHPVESPKCSQCGSPYHAFCGDHFGARE